MPTLQIESSSDVIDLAAISKTDYGMEALSGVTGLGLPPVTVQWLEGAGDGSVYRGQRIMPRDIDIPVYIHAHDRDELKSLVSRFSRMFTGTMTLRFIEDDGTNWSLEVHRVGGGGWTYGTDTTGETEVRTVVTVRAPDPYWVYSEPDIRIISTTNVGRGLIKATSLSKLRLAGSSASGLVLMENSGDVPSYPIWTLVGPGANFTATSPTGQVLNWTGTLAAGETLTIDTRTASVRDGTGANRYSSIAAAPRFWPVPAGTSQAAVSMGSTTSASQISALWYPRKWAVI